MVKIGIDLFYASPASTQAGIASFGVTQAPLGCLTTSGANDDITPQHHRGSRRRQALGSADAQAGPPPTPLLNEPHFSLTNVERSIFLEAATPGGAANRSRDADDGAAALEQAPA